MAFDGEDSGAVQSLLPALVSLTPMVLPSTRRLSSCFTQPSKPAVKPKRQLAWLSLQGRLVGAEEATSARTVDTGGVFTAKEAVAWELFTPIQRVLVVAVASAAAVNSNKNKQISQLQKSVELRDQVLLGMQQKLDSLCEQLGYFKDQPEVVMQSEAFVTKGLECGRRICQNHDLPSNGSLFSSANKGLTGEESFKDNIPICNEAEPEERRMSDLSDWAPSVSSSVDVQLDSLSIGHEISNLRKECEEKDVTIRKLSTFIQSSDVSGSKRVLELEDIIRRKNMIINKLRKDIIVLEQKVVNLTRVRRRSFAQTSSSMQRTPAMTDNVLYDMDSTTGPSSSDSDNSHNNERQALALRMREAALCESEEAPKGGSNSGQVKRSAVMDKKQSSLAPSPWKENSMNQTPTTASSLRTKHAAQRESSDYRSKRLHPARSKEVAASKRWA